MGLGLESRMASEAFESFDEGIEGQRGQACSTDGMGVIEEKLVQRLSLLSDHSEILRKMRR